MSLKCGIVGLPNVGKSTLFNALTESSIPAENYPFCTIEPHIGIVELPDSRLMELGKIYKPQKIIPATVEFTDIAGLVRGASRGEGLGNQFLGQIRQTNLWKSSKHERNRQTNQEIRQTNQGVKRIRQTISLRGEADSGE